jgi:hypothetical protein
MRLYARDGVGTVAMTNATGFDLGRLLDKIDASSVHESGRDGRRHERQPTDGSGNP